MLPSAEYLVLVSLSASEDYRAVPSLNEATHKTATHATVPRTKASETTETQTEDVFVYQQLTMSRK